DEFHRLKREGRTILFVTHDMGAVERFCHRAMLLDKGRMVSIGEPGAIARQYNQMNFGQTVHQLAENGDAPPRSPRDPAAQILDAWFEDLAGQRIAALAHGEPCQVCIEIRFNEDLTDPIFGATLRNDVGATVFATTTAHGHGPTGSFAAGETAIVRLRFDNWLAASRYTVTPSIARDGLGADALDLREDLASLLVHGGPWTGGVANL